MLTNFLLPVKPIILIPILEALFEKKSPNTISLKYILYAKYRMEIKAHK